MIIHLIALAKFDDEAFAYHFSSADYQDIINKRIMLVDKTKDIPPIFSVHVLKTNDLSFQSVQDMDPYFGDTQEFFDLDSFIDRIREHLKLTSVDVAAYLKQKYGLQPFSLEKTLYYIYADYLESERKPLFSAQFVAFDRGPVDRKVYRINRHHQDILREKNNLEVKTIATGKFTYLTQLIDEEVKKYSRYFDSVWTNGNENPTHRGNTPWSIARDRGGQNAAIDDQLILEHHHLERFK